MKTRKLVENIALFILFIAFPCISSAQKTEQTKGVIRGIIADADSKKGIELATIKILNFKDSTLISGIPASDTGEFNFSHKFGKYIFEASFVGYHKQHRNIELSEKRPIVDLDTIFLKADDIFLEEVQVTAQLPAMQVKGDTIEFNAGAYSIDGSNVLSDLIKQIPGLELDENGNLKANGKAISKILVDGKEYFGNDISKALTTLPANMINKLQLFEKESEEAKASGIKDAEPEQVLNLDVKEEFKKSTFGDLKSGVGNKGRHVNKVNLNRMHGDNQYSIIGNINNINDYGGYGGYGMRSFGANFDDNINKEIGANFNIQQSEKFSINGSANYRNDKSINESISDSYSSTLKQYSNRESKGINRNQNMDMNATIDWKPDSLTTIYFRTNFSFSNGNNTATSTDSATMMEMEDILRSRTLTETKSFSKNNGFRTNNSLMVSRRLNSKGRNISFNLNQGYNNSDGDGTNYSEKRYLIENEEDQLSIIDQQSKNKSTSVNYGFSARYVEPLGKDNRIYASYSINISSSERIGDVRKIDPATGEYTIVDEDYSRTTKSSSLRQSVRLGFQHTKEKYNFNLSFAANPSYTRNKSYLLGVLLENTNIEQKVVNFSPNARFAWTPDKNTHIGFSYYGSTNHPSINQLSADTVRHSATNKSVGDPNLKPSFNNSFGIDFRKSNFEKGSYFSANINYSYTFNNVVSYQMVDEHSNTTNTYRNVDGNSNAYLYLTYNTPLRNKKFNVGGHLHTSYNRNIAFLNQKKKTIDRISLAPTFFGRFNSSKVETSINFGLSHTIAENSLSEKKRSTNTDYRLSHQLKVKLPLDFVIESDLRFSYRSGYGEEVKKDETMWNLSASKLFLKEKRGSLKIELFDVLNDLRQQENTVNGSDYDNYWRRVVNNYFIVSFSYRFNIAGGKS